MVSKSLNASQDFAVRAERHLFVCQFWECAGALRSHPELQRQLRGAVMAIHEHNNRKWSGSQPAERQIVVPYVANTYLTERLELGNMPLNKRPVRLFAKMSDSGKIRPKLATFNWTHYDSLVNVGDYARHSSAANYTESYGAPIFRAQFCMHVGGHTPTSRRLFDVMIAGCIPVIVSDKIWPHLPFHDTIPWLDIAIFIPERDIDKKNISAFDPVWEMSSEEAQKRQSLLLEHREKILYGSGDPWAQKPIFGEAATEVEHEFKSYLSRPGIQRIGIVDASSERSQSVVHDTTQESGSSRSVVIRPQKYGTVQLVRVDQKLFKPS